MMRKGNSVLCEEMKSTVQLACLVFFNKGTIEDRPLILRYDNGVRTMGLGRYTPIEKETVAK